MNLRDHPFLAGLSPRYLQILGENAWRWHLEPDESIFREGNPADSFYLIETGEVALESRTQNMGISLVQTLGAGEVLGWSWLFPPYQWHFDARTLEAADLIVINGARLREYCEANHDLGYEMLKRMAQVMMHRLQATRRRLLDLPNVPS